MIKGWEVHKTESLKETVEVLLRKELNVEGNIKGTYSSGKGQQGRSMVVAELESWEMKREVMARKSRLNGKKLYIDKDMTYKEREIQKQLGEIAEQERKKGSVVRIGYRKITIDGQKFL